MGTVIDITKPLTKEEIAAWSPVAELKHRFGLSQMDNAQRLERAMIEEGE